MRVLHININYSTSSLHQVMVEQLERLGVKNKVFAPTYDRRKTVISPKEYVVISECLKKWHRFCFRYKQKKILSALLKSYDIYQFDLIHAYTLFTDGNVALNAFKQFGVPYVVAVRNTDVNLFFKKLIHLRKRGVEILRNAKRVFFLSPSYKEMVLGRYVPPKYRNEIESKSLVIPNGIDAYWLNNIYFRDVPEVLDEVDSERLLKFVFVGAIEPNKNIELVLKALSLISRQGVSCSLTVIGKVINKKTFRTIKKYSCLIFEGQKRKEEILEYFRAADIFVMVSHTESFGLVYAEAMSQGLPVIYTKGQGFDGQFLNGVVGYGASDQSVDSLVEAIGLIVKNYKRLSNNASSLVSKFNWEIICKQYIDIYSTVCERETRNRGNDDFK